MANSQNPQGSQKRLNSPTSHRQGSQQHTLNDPLHSHHPEGPKPTLLERVVAQLADLTISCVEPLLKTISTFGIIGAAILGISFGKSVEFLPYIIAIGSTVAIIALWRSNNRAMVQQDHKEIQRLKKELLQLNQTLEEYDERIGNIEVLESFEERLARNELDKRSGLVSRPAHRDDSKDFESETPPPVPSHYDSD